MQESDIVNVKQAAQILSEKTGRSISQDYIRQLRRYGKLQAINEPTTEEEKGATRVYLFRRSDVEAVEIGASRERGVRKPRQQKNHPSQPLDN